MRPGCLGISGTVRRRGHDDVGGAACRSLIGRRGAGRNEDGGVGVCHIFGENVELVGEDLFEVVVEGRTSTTNAE